MVSTGISDNDFVNLKVFYHKLNAIGYGCCKWLYGITC